MEEVERTEAEDIIRAIRNGEVDAFVVKEAMQERIYSLRSADLLYRAMVEEMKDGAVALDTTGLIVYCNAYFAHLVKADRVALVGKRIFSLFPEAETFFDLTEERTRTGTSRQELSLRASDGSEVPVLAAMNWIRLDGTDVYCLIVTDLTEQKHRDQLLIEGRRKDEFLAMLAHELRNPIAPIRYAAARLRGPGKVQTPERMEWARNVIDRQVDQLTRLVDDLLDVSRITRGRVSLNLEPVEVDAIVSRAVEAARPLIDERNQQLMISPPRKRLRVNGDLTRLAQVISNLLNNASKFTGAGGQLTVAVDEERGDPGWVRIAVGDNGAGIAPEELPAMFDLFTQGDTGQDRAQGGLGIGLTLVRSFVEMHGGTVIGESEGRGRGSRFTVRLPLLRTADPEVSRRERGDAAAPEDVRPRRMLVVDDNADVAESLSEWLGDDGHEVRVARTGAAALQEAEAFRPEVMFVDVGLPDMSGHDVARKVRQMPGLEDAVLIAVTGYGQQNDRRRSREAGFDHHWIKPLTVEMLSDLLASLDAADRAAT